MNCAFYLFIIFFFNIANAQLVHEKSSISILGIRVSFLEDDEIFTTGNGYFLYENQVDKCGDYTIDPPPHNRKYFQDQLISLNNYYSSVSKNNFKIDLINSDIYPLESEKSYQLDSTISSFYPYNDLVNQDLGLARLFEQSLLTAFQEDNIDFDKYDLIVIFHAGIGQDFSLPYIDPTPSDIPSSYIDSNFLLEQLGKNRIDFGNGSFISSGIILPESQNHLLYNISDEIFIGVEDPCDYQFALTGTFAFMVGLAIGLPSLYSFENDQSSIGVFGLMDQGSNNGRGIIPAPPNPWTRIWAGWENPKTIYESNFQEIISRDSIVSEILKININKDEYFLIENRNNWIKNYVDIDSLILKEYSNQNTKTYTELILDSINIERNDLTKVITSIPNYDYGLPGSGILIWHIDEKMIFKDFLSNKNYNNILNGGIHIEEGDGAQDIGSESQFIFVDPTLGLWSDFWFKNNNQYFISNQVLSIDSIIFNVNSFPNSRSNSGSDSHIFLSNFSTPGKIMNFSFMSPLLIDEFQNFDFNMILGYDFDKDEIEEIIGINDSFWWTSGSKFEPQNFLSINNNSKYLYTLTNLKNQPELAIVYFEENNLNLILLEYKDSFLLKWVKKLNFLSLPQRISGINESSTIKLHYEEKIIEISESSFNEITLNEDISLYNELKKINWYDNINNLSGYVAILKDGGLKSVLGQNIFLNFENIQFTSLNAIDLNLDGNINFLSKSKNGDLYAFNNNLSLKHGFPIKGDFIGNIFASDIINDKYPEIILKNSSGDIKIINLNGKTELSISSDTSSKLIMIGEFLGKNSIFTSSQIFSFENYINDLNNWNLENGNFLNDRTIYIYNNKIDLDNLKIFNKSHSFVYPNPVMEGKTKFRLSIENADQISINIFDISGSFVEKIEILQIFQNQINEFDWDVSNIDDGVYFANIKVTYNGITDNKIVSISIIN